MSIDNERQNRRGWFTACARLAVLGGCAAGSAVLLSREGECHASVACDQCGKLPDCGLPQALSVKGHLRGTSNGK